MKVDAVSLSLTICFDGQFYVGIWERLEDDKLSACRTVFGTEPKDGELTEFFNKNWKRLRFDVETEIDTRSALASNPKRRQRQAAALLQQRGGSTKSQEVLQRQREIQKQSAQQQRRARSEEEKEIRFQQKQMKKKQKRRGH